MLEIPVIIDQKISIGNNHIGNRKVNFKYFNIDAKKIIREQCHPMQETKYNQMLNNRTKISKIFELQRSGS